MRKDGPSSNYEDCYFQHGDVLEPASRDQTLPETTDFKLHRDILSRYSLFFRDYFENRALPDDHVQDPVLLEIAKWVDSGPTDFRNLCRFMYPNTSAAGCLPHIEAGDIDEWDSTIKAAIEFDMPAIRAYIMNKLTQDEEKFTTKAVSFLKWEMKLKRGDQELVLRCYRALAFCRLPLSPSELTGLPDDIVCKLTLIHERARSLFLDHQKLRSWMPIPPPESCARPSVCQDSIINGLVHNMTNLSPDANTLMFGSIFDNLESGSICGSCRIPGLLDPLIKRLNLELGPYIEELNRAG